MNKQEQRIAIAEACGWLHPNNPECIKRKKGTSYESRYKDSGGWWMKPNGDYTIGEYLPDYLNDLNAMHEAELTLTDEQWERYWHELNGIVLGVLYLPRATAAQRAEAFLKTLNLWTK